MGDARGFLTHKRKDTLYRPVCERLEDFKEVYCQRNEEQSLAQASRCMDCGTPFCNWGCPLGNYIPEWNNYVCADKWENAWRLLEATNNLPEITGRVCPAPCEYACVLGINDDPVTVRENELAIAEYGYAKGFLCAQPSQKRTGKKVAIIGSGPAGLSCADQLNSAGHRVVVFERDSKIGGILRYGIPDFKLEKSILDRRLRVWAEEGIEFRANTYVGRDLSIEALKVEFDALCLAGGCRVPRDMCIEGRAFRGIHFAIDYLIQANKIVSGEKITDDNLLHAKGRRVVVIGGGDTGADCVGVANRQGARCVIQIELLPQPPSCRTESMQWPKHPFLLKTSTSHEEGGERQWSVMTKRFIGKNGCVEKLSCVKVDFSLQGQAHCPLMQEIPGSEFEIEADLVILAMGFLQPEQELLKKLQLALDNRGNVKTDSSYVTSQKGIFAAGDVRRGQSLVVWAIAEGRNAAYCIDKYLMGVPSLAPTHTC
ncbi:MAG: glutamate synthase subunit beta [Candidatus Omnitrophota bacterium]|nr:MAG: glutamate synthase subunit beta [Candidatus Omnitrophota bacterium]